MNQLAHIDEFRKALSTPHLSASAQKTLAATPLVLLVGVTSSGRNTIIRELLKTGDYHYIISDTTRQPRVKNGVPIEKDGRDYWFRSEEDMLADIQDGEFLEAAIIHEQQVSGTSIREIEKASQAKHIAIADVEPVGAANIHELKEDATIIFVVPPNLDELLSRLRSRSDLPEDEIRRRIEGACKELAMVLQEDYYTFVCNDVLEDAVADVHQIAKASEYDAVKETNARNVAEQLYKDAQNYLKR
jgi:guanylate kinase